MKCSHCGFLNLDGACFCCHCGVKFGDIVKCPSCAGHIPSEAIFCPECGVRLKVEEEEKKKKTEAIGDPDVYNRDKSLLNSLEYLLSNK